MRVTWSPDDVAVWRHALMLSRAELAAELNGAIAELCPQCRRVTARTVRNYESGVQFVPSHVAEAFGVVIERFRGRTGAHQELWRRVRLLGDGTIGIRGRRG